MTSAFSSNDESVISRIVEEDANTPTPIELIPIKYELDRCVAWIKELQLQRVCLQFPNKLLSDSISVSKYLKRKTLRDIYILGDTNYGSCCVDLIAAAHVPSDGLIHFNDACLSNLENPKIPLLFVFPKTEIDHEALKKCIEEESKQHEYSLVVYDCNCSHFDSTELFAESEKVIFSKLVTGETASFAHIGCKGLCGTNCERKTASDKHQTVSLGRGFCLPDGVNCKDVYLIFVGEENLFLHTVLSCWTHKFKEITCVNSHGSKYQPSFQLEKALKRQLFMVQQVKEASSVAIILANPADPSIQRASVLARELLKSRPNPPKVYTLAVGKPNPAKLANFQDIELFVLLACPNNSLLSPSTRQAACKEYYKPIIGLGEVELAINKGRTSAGVDYKEFLDGGFDFVALQKSDPSLEADISLLTGRIIDMSTDSSIPCDSSLVSKGDNMKVANVSIGGLLVNRTWQGLDPSLGKDTPALVMEGRSGIAFSYQSEPK